jgi:2-polyprenyl-3-methyl-5-hydroxy-6-metoxy-1,4-benzoquinol methylase
MNSVIKLASCDEQSTVYIGNDNVYRVIKSGHETTVISVLEQIEEKKITGIIDTEICSINERPVIDKVLPDALIFKHRKISPISYPHEWCVSMLRDAALFHVQLSKQLLEKKLYLKDAHPWNILFDNGNFVFVDFTSIVNSESLLKELYLDANRKYLKIDVNKRLALVTAEIYRRMYRPYFLDILLAGIFIDRRWAAAELLDTTINTSNRTIDVIAKLSTNKKKFSRQYLYNVINILKNKWKFINILKKLESNANLNCFFNNVEKFTQNLPLTPPASAYTEYYRLKNEDSEWGNQAAWSEKQKSVFAIIEEAVDSETILDVACNTGWYAILAAKMGKKVTAFDIDEACIEQLYDEIKKQRLPVQPLLIDLTKMATERGSQDTNELLLLSASSRFKSDVVMALGIIHHLYLGEGLSFEQILNILTPLTKTILIIEFVNATDEVIQNEPNFFPAYANSPEIVYQYKIERMLEVLKNKGFKIEIKKSVPQTRCLLVCKKMT